MRNLRHLVFLLAAAAVLPACAREATPVRGYTVVHRYPHDPKAFTEGLFYEDGFLYESTGEYDGAGVRKVELDTGKVVQQRDVPQGYFGEGIVFAGPYLLQLTWRQGVGFLYDRSSFELKGTLRYSGEGWALTRDATHLYMSDGTPVIRVLDPDTFKQTGSITVTDDGVPVQMVNELEWVKGAIYANVWQTSRIARIDPKTGKVIDWIELAPLVKEQHVGNDPDAVLNGIAYDAKHDRLFITGKRWSNLYEIKIKP
ncbi:glutaminyl-peptide cyclotransferase [Luteibacter aegosomaticola]|uniref:glutaminyl-peptide cyclotransferase n=1 Tax=Luteibacter aegosomaticola TaxID=2911538 RepID=UPI001FF97BE4|nr:glutaminyl-peptide cyclotransferase [Luteibacter aegosomaticola]UPG90977.1 glutaminyl-peptide cyclotransferase [Luteibacter aegosomaticola]